MVLSQISLVGLVNKDASHAVMLKGDPVVRWTPKAKILVHQSVLTLKVNVGRLNMPVRPYVITCLNFAGSSVCLLTYLRQLTLGGIRLVKIESENQNNERKKSVLTRKVAKREHYIWPWASQQPRRKGKRDWFHFCPRKGDPFWFWH